MAEQIGAHALAVCEFSIITCTYKFSIDSGSGLAGFEEATAGRATILRGVGALVGNFAD